MNPPTSQEIAQCFNAPRIPPVKVGILYRVGVVLVAISMVLLPAIYLALVAATAWGVWLWARFGLEILAHRISVLTFLIVATPFLAGSIMVFFMFKPLLARPAKPPERLTLVPGENPLLEDFVKRVCHAVGAPVPRRIRVMTEVNASAGPSGGFFSLLARRLDLTIGLPLTGLRLQSFGGILAHEFGHFAQGGGMTLTYLIRTVNHWFARVVYERDAWDDRLETAAAEADDWRLQIPLQVCRGGVWLSRRMLWVLMHVGNAISCFALRQMEYDADACEAAFAGSDEFAVTCKAMAELNAGQAHAAKIIREAWPERRLARSLPGLVCQRAESLTNEERESAFKEAVGQKTGFWDTHPCDADRIRAAGKLKLGGIFSSDLPASVLFGDLDRIGAEASVRFYQDQLGLDLADAVLVESRDLVGDADDVRDGEAAVERFFFGKIDPGRPWLPLMPDFSLSAPSPDEVAGIRRELELAATDTDAGVFEAFNRTRRRIHHLVCGKALAEAGFTLQPKEFGLATATVTSLDDAIRQCRTELSGWIERLGTFDRLAARSLQAALHAAHHRDAAAQAEIGKLMEIHRKMVSEFPILEAMREVVSAGEVLCQNSQANVPGLLRAFERNASRAADLTSKLEMSAGGIPLVFAKPGGDATIADVIRRETAEAARSGAPAFIRPVIAAERIIDRIHPFVWRLLGRLVVLAEMPGQSDGTEPGTP